MNRVDIVGVPGAGKSTFLDKYKFDNVEEEDYAKRKAAIRGVKAQLIYRLLPNASLKHSFVKRKYKDFINMYEIAGIMEERNHHLLKSLQEDQLGNSDSYFVQFKRLVWLIARLEEVEILEDHYRKNALGKVVLFDESLLHKLILAYVNLDLDTSHFLLTLSHLSPPKGLLVFKNDLEISAERVIERRIKQNSGRPTDKEELQKLRGEAQRYQELLELSIEFHTGKIPLEIIDLRADEANNHAKAEAFFQSFRN